ncbi:hypothetical protein DPMN_051155 [Dreissena polymorpha]|uniref:Uncharacterized protein n=1 Tax=Dreissena polymorpha TaxID=45954 RepID=A0A9D4HNN3_DREPO|nr:hypothetical protein DPMN_051155 [Dreissena polymorpha]
MKLYQLVCQCVMDYTKGLCLVPMFLGCPVQFSFMEACEFGCRSPCSNGGVSSGYFALPQQYKIKPNLHIVQ